MKYGQILTVTLFAVLSALSIQLLAGSPASAANPSEFIAGRIIDDEVFYDKDGMTSVAEIQAFLDAHTPSCDTWGTRSSGYGNLTNAQYAQQIMGWPGPPYVCLNNYYENPSTGQTSFEAGGGAFSGGLSAAQIIYNAAQQYGINPKVLMVLLRRESLNLYSDAWPLKSQYKYAMGYACPDSGPGYSANCQNDKAGFYKQMTLAAWQLRYYYNNMGSYNYAPGRWNTIQYSPNPACGTKNVYIENAATASLYIYTPYTPNDAALNAYPGTANCGAYGNRNFWFYWHEWFGSPLGLDSFVSITEGVGVAPSPIAMYNGDSVNMGFTVRNRSATKAVSIGNLSVCARRASDGKNLDLPWRNNIVIQPGRTWTFTDVFTAPSADSYSFWICNYRNSTGFSNTFPQSATSDIVRSRTQLVKKTPTLTTSIISTGGEVIAGKPFTLQFSIKNNDSTAIPLGSVLAGVRSSSLSSFDFPLESNIALQPGQTYTYSRSGMLPNPGQYRAFVSILRPDFGWNERIATETPSISREVILTVQPNPRMVSSVSLSTGQTIVGKNVQVQFGYRNDSPNPIQLGSVVAVAVAPDGKKEYFPLIQNITIQPGQTYTYNETTALMRQGQYRVFASVLRPSGIWDEQYPVLSGVVREAQINVEANPKLTTSITSDSVEIVAGKPFNLKFSMKNDGDVPIRVGKPIAAVRGQNSKNVDFPIDADTTIQPGATYVYNKTATIANPGEHRAFVSVLGVNNQWNEAYPTLNSGVNRSYTFTVQPNPRMSSSLTLDRYAASIGQPIAVSFQYRNDSPNPIQLGSLVAVIMDANGKKEYFPFIQDITIQPGQTYTYSGSTSIAKAGQYRVFASVQLPNGVWNEQYPVTSSGVLRERNITID